MEKKIRNWRAAEPSGDERGDTKIRLGKTDAFEALAAGAAAVHVGQAAAVSQSFSFDQRRRPEMFFTAIATAFFCPTNTTNRLPRVMPV